MHTLLFFHFFFEDSISLNTHSEHVYSFGKDYIVVSDTPPELEKNGEKKYTQKIN